MSYVKISFKFLFSMGQKLSSNFLDGPCSLTPQSCTCCFLFLKCPSFSACLLCFFLSFQSALPALPLGPSLGPSSPDSQGLPGLGSHGAYYGPQMAALSRIFWNCLLLGFSKLECEYLQVSARVLHIPGDRYMPAKHTSVF